MKGDSPLDSEQEVKNYLERVEKHKKVRAQLEKKTNQGLNFFQRIDRRQSENLIHLKAHGLDKRLDLLPGIPNVKEIERQIDYLIEHYGEEDIPLEVIKHRAVEILACFVDHPDGIPPNLVLLLGTILDIKKGPLAGYKKRCNLKVAQWYIKENPSASDREIAKEAKVSPSTIGKWKENGDL